jgi:hypothetical protein
MRTRRHPPRARQIASNQTWSELRAMMTAFLPNATGDANDILAQCEAGRPTASVAPFANMTDRPFWIPGASINLPFRDLYASDVYLQGPYGQADSSWRKAQCFAAYGMASTVGAAGVACNASEFSGVFDFQTIQGPGNCESPSWLRGESAAACGRDSPRLPHSLHSTNRV